MATSFKEFAQLVLRLETQSEDIRSNRDYLDRRIAGVETELERLRKQRVEADEQLVRIEAEQKALMENSSPAFAATATTQSNQSRNSESAASTSSTALIQDETARVFGTLSNSQIEQHTLALPAAGVKSDIIDREHDNDNITAIPRSNPHHSAWPQPAPPAKATANSPNTGARKSTNSKLFEKSIHPNFPTVIYMDDEWVEISCGICGANANQHKYGGNPRFLKGIIGIHTHARWSHKDEAATHAVDTLKTCQRRVISEGDVALMKAGAAPTVKIEMNVGPRSSVNNAPTSRSTPASKQNQLPSSLTRQDTPDPNESERQSAVDAPAKRLTKYEEFQQIEALSAAAVLPKRKKRKFSLDNLKERANSDADQDYGDDEGNSDSFLGSKDGH